MTEAGDLGAAGLDAVAQLTRLGQVPEELGPAPPAVGVRLRLPGLFGLFGPFGLFDAAKSSRPFGPIGPIGPFGPLGSSESVQLLRGLLFPVRHRHTTPGRSLPPSL